MTDDGAECFFSKFTGLFSMQKRRLQGDLVPAFQHLKWPTRELEGVFLYGHLELRQGAMALN